MAVLAALAIASGTAVFLAYGWDAVATSLIGDVRIVAGMVPFIALGLVIAGCAQEITRRWPLSRWLGQGSGLRGLLIANGAGIITPGGPFTSFPLVLALHRAGASVAVTVTYVTAWSVAGLHRMLVWELPFLGLNFTITRFLVSLPLAIVAGLAAYLLVAGRPIGPSIEEAGEP